MTARRSQSKLGRAETGVAETNRMEGDVEIADRFGLGSARLGRRRLFGRAAAVVALPAAVVAAGLPPARAAVSARQEPAAATATADGGEVATAEPKTGFVPVDGLELYYEIHGPADGAPLVLLHGAYGSTAMWAGFVPTLAETRWVIVPEMQGHGHTADIDRPLGFERMADDVAGLLDHLEIARADVFGYSMGGQIALQVAIRHPERVRKLVVASAPAASAGWHPEVIETASNITPELFADTPITEEYERVAPNPEGFPGLVAKLNELVGTAYAWPDEAIRAIAAPTMFVIGDSDGVPPAYAAVLFALRGGGVFGDMAGLPNARLAVLPGTTHVGVIERAGWLLPMIEEFLQVPMPEGR